MDDLLIGASSNEEMVQNLCTVFERLAKFNLKIRISKTKFWETEVKVLGTIFSSTGQKVDPDRIKAIEDFGPIDTLKRCQQFMGMIAFISSFIPHFSTICFPIYSLLKNQKGKKYQVTEEAEAAVQSIIKIIKLETMKYNPDFSSPFYLATDASQVGSGAFLYQLNVYEKTEEGKKKMLESLGYYPEQEKSVFLIPGVSPGKNTPIVTHSRTHQKTTRILMCSSP
jgi:hypothetical protein